jgi:predicted GNAT family acetyltransferase
MTKVAFQSNARDFLERCGKILEKDPIEHNLILSLCQAAERRRVNGEDSNIKCAIVTDDDGEFVVGAVQAPPHNLVLSKAQSLDIDQLAETLLKHKFTFPGIVGPSDVTGTFAEKWTALTSLHTEESMDQIIYMLKGRELLMPTVEGEMRFAGKADVKQITEWIGAFSKSALPRAEQINTKDAKAQAEELAESGRLAFWTVKGTPPENRGHGYASAVVANLTKLQLDQGKTMSCLYADARNTQANSIYRKIGYEFAGRSTLYVLGKAS